VRGRVRLVHRHLKARLLEVRPELSSLQDKEGKTMPCRGQMAVCVSFAPIRTNSRVGRIGGRRNRHSFTGLADFDERPENRQGIQEECARLLENIYSGKIPPKVATCIGPLLSLQMRVIQVAEREARITRLEQARTSNGEHSNHEVAESPIETERDKRGESGK